MKHARFLFVCLLLVCTGIVYGQIPATINIQGVLRNANGTAIPDGTHALIFKFYEEAEVGAGTAKWTENQDVEVTSGIYTAVLGSVVPFSGATPPITFDRQYFLEVVINGKPLLPRVPLTPAPYALSLLGDPNTFPSSGAIRADGAVIGEDLDQALLDLSPEHSIVIKGGTLARGATGSAGSPGADGVNNNGYAFTNDKDSGLFSTGDGKVAVYTGNTEQLLVTHDTVKVQNVLNVAGDINASDNLNMPNTKGITYNGEDDWRLVYWEDFKNGANGWQWYAPSTGENIGWNNGTAGGNATVQGTNSTFAGSYIVPGTSGLENRRVLKKAYDMANVGAYDFIKIKFKYYLLDAWDGYVNPGNGDSQDMAWAAIAETANATQFRVGWVERGINFSVFGGVLPTTAWNTATNFGSESFSDYTMNGEMTFFKCTSCSSNIWVMFGSGNQLGAFNENYGVGMIEIWVK